MASKPKTHNIKIKTRGKKKEKAFNHKVSSCFLNMQEIHSKFKIKKKKVKISKITFEREQQRGNNESIDPVKLLELKRKAFVINDHLDLKKKKKTINQNFHYEIRNTRITQERGKIKLGNGEETKSDDEIQRETSDKRERAY